MLARQGSSVKYLIPLTPAAQYAALIMRFFHTKHLYSSICPFPGRRTFFRVLPSQTLFIFLILFFLWSDWGLRVSLPWLSFPINQYLAVWWCCAFFGFGKLFYFDSGDFDGSSVRIDFPRSILLLRVFRWKTEKEFIWL